MHSKKSRDRYLFDVEFIPPRTTVEAALADIWETVLAVDRVGIHDDFFAFDGDSLLALEIVAGIRERLSVELSMGDLFEAPTVAALAGRVSSHTAGKQGGSRGP